MERINNTVLMWSVSFQTDSFVAFHGLHYGAWSTRSYLPMLHSSPSATTAVVFVVFSKTGSCSPFSATVFLPRFFISINEDYKALTDKKNLCIEEEEEDEEEKKKKKETKYGRSNRDYVSDKIFYSS